MSRRHGDAAARPAHRRAQLRAQAAVEAAAAGVMDTPHDRAVKRNKDNRSQVVHRLYYRLIYSSLDQPGATSMGFGEAFSSVLGNYVTFSGRAPRSEYWYWALFLF